MARQKAEGSVKTPYGALDRDVLSKLRDEYDTTALLKIIDELDDLTADARGEDGLRDLLLRLHSMAHTVINDADINVPANSESLPELAQEITLQLSSAITLMEKWVRRIAPLEKLGTDDD